MPSASPKLITVFSIRKPNSRRATMPGEDSRSGQRLVKEGSELWAQARPREKSMPQLCCADVLCS